MSSSDPERDTDRTDLGGQLRDTDPHQPLPPVSDTSPTQRLTPMSAEFTQPDVVEVTQPAAPPPGAVARPRRPSDLPPAFASGSLDTEPLEAARAIVRANIDETNVQPAPATRAPKRQVVKAGLRRPDAPLPAEGTEVVARPGASEETQIVGRRGGSSGEETMVVDRSQAGLTIDLKTTDPQSPMPPHRQRRGGGALAALVVAVILGAAVTLLGMRQGWWRIARLERFPGVRTLVGGPEREIAQLLAEATKAADERRWHDVTVLVNAVLMLRPDHEAALELAVRAADALERAPLEAAHAAIDVEDWREADRRLRSLPEAQRDDAWNQLFERAQTGLRTQLLRDAEAAAAAGETADLEAILADLDAAGFRGPDVERLRARQSKESGEDRAVDRDGKRKRPPSRRGEAEALYQEAQTLIFSKQDQDARRVLDKCLKLNPKHALGHRAMGIVLVRLGENERAAKHYEKFVELRPEAPEAQKIREMLSRFKTR